MRVGRPISGAMGTSRSGATALMSLALAVLGLIVLAIGVRLVRMSRPPPAAHERYAPLLDGRLVYQVTKTLTRTVYHGDLQESVDTFEDRYFFRAEALPSDGGLTVVAGAGTTDLSMARSTTAEHQRVHLVHERAGLHVGSTLLMPILDEGRPTAWAITTREGPPPFWGWPLLDSVELSAREGRALGQSTLDPESRGILGMGITSRGVGPRSAFNPVSDETIRFYQRAPIDVEAGGRVFRCLEIDYQGQRTDDESTHVIEGKLFFARRIGIVKERRQVRLRARERMRPRRPWEGGGPRVDRAVSLAADVTRTVAQRL